MSCHALTVFTDKRAITYKPGDIVEFVFQGERLSGRIASIPDLADAVATFDIAVVETFDGRTVNVPASFMAHARPLRFRDNEARDNALRELDKAHAVNAELLSQVNDLTDELQISMGGSSLADLIRFADTKGEYVVTRRAAAVGREPESARTVSADAFKAAATTPADAVAIGDDDPLDHVLSPLGSYVYAPSVATLRETAPALADLVSALPPGTTVTITTPKEDA